MNIYDKMRNKISCLTDKNKTVVYYTGDLASLSHSASVKLLHDAFTSWCQMLVAKGKYTFVQKKLGIGADGKTEYDYIAIKIK